MEYKGVSYHFEKLENKYNINETFFKLITNKQVLATTINYIEADRDIHIELTQFIYNTDFYIRLEEKLLTQRKVLASKNDFKERIAINEVILKIEEEVKHYKIDVLNTAVLLLEVHETTNLILAKNHFFKGELAAANAIFNTVELENIKQQLSKQLLIQKKLEEVYSKLVDNAFEFAVKAQLTSLNLDIIEPENRFQKAVEFFEKGMMSVERSKQTEQEAKYKHDYGMFLHRNNQTEKSLHLLEDTLAKYQLLSTDNPIIHVFDVVTVQTNITVIQQGNSNFEKAEKSLTETLAFFRMMNDIFLSIFSTNLGWVLYCLGHLFYEKRDLEKSKEYFLESCDIRKNLSLENNEDYLNDLAYSLNGCIVVHQDLHQFDEVEEYYSQIFELYQELLEINQRKYISDYGLALNNYGTFLREKHDYIQAEETFKEVVEIYQNLSEQNPRTYLPLLSQSLNHLGIAQSENEKISKAEESCEKALIINRQLIETNPKLHIEGLGKNLIALGSLKIDKEEFEGAEKALTEALEIYEYLSSKNPNIYFKELKIIYNTLGILFHDKHLYEKAEIYYLNGLSTVEDFVNQNFEIYSLEIVDVYFNLAKLNQDIQSFQNAENYFNQCIEIYQSLSVKNPKIYLPYLARTQINLALMYQENISEREKSIDLLHKAIERLERFDKKEFEEALQSAYEILEKWNVERQ